MKYPIVLIVRVLTKEAIGISIRIRSYKVTKQAVTVGDSHMFVEIIPLYSKYFIYTNFFTSATHG